MHYLKFYSFKQTCYLSINNTFVNNLSQLFFFYVTISLAIHNSLYKLLKLTFENSYIHLYNCTTFWKTKASGRYILYFLTCCNYICTHTCNEKFPARVQYDFPNKKQTGKLQLIKMALSEKLFARCIGRLHTIKHYYIIEQQKKALKIFGLRTWCTKNLSDIESYITWYLLTSCPGQDVKTPILNLG